MGRFLITKQGYCDICSFECNTRKQAKTHTNETGHHTTMEYGYCELIEPKEKKQSTNKTEINQEQGLTANNKI